MSSPQTSFKEKSEHVEQHVGNNGLADANLVGINRRLLLLNLWSMVAALTYGFNAALIASSLGQPNLFVYFNFENRTNATGVIGAIAAMLNVGGIIGVPAIVYISDKFGRKWAFFGACCFSFVGAALGAGAQNLAMLLVARLITGMGAWSNLMCAVTYQQEIAPATRRGLLAGSVGVGISCGYVSAAWVGVGFFFVSNKNNWRIPLVLQIIPPLITCFGLLVVPNSPRWLANNGRSEEALEVLKKIHYSKADPTYIVAREEHFQMVSQAELDKSLPNSWIAMFTTYKKRTWAAILVMVANQSTGVQIMANFGPRLYAALGYSPLQSLLIAGGWITMTIAFQFASAFFTDKIGRRWPLIFSVISSGGVFMAMEAGTLARIEAGDTNSGITKAAVAALFLFIIGYSAGEPISYLYIGECFPNLIRVKGIAIGLITINLMTIWITQSQPTAAATIGYKFYLIFVVLSVVTSIMQYLWLPETANVPLEEMAKIFGDGEQVAVFSRDIYVDETTHEIVASHHV